jgi:uncharacterized protein (UPF0179 family)
MEFIKAPLQKMAVVDSYKSCKSLIQGKAYRIMKIRKFNSQFIKDEETVVAELQTDDDTNLKVYLPSRIKGSMISETYIETYNACELYDKLHLTFKGMKGRCIDIEII